MSLGAESRKLRWKVEILPIDFGHFYVPAKV
jgi:hypothetical protein